MANASTGQPAVAAAIQARKEVFVVRGRPAVGSAFAKAIEDLLKLAAARHDYASVNRPQLEEQPKIVQVPVKERIFVIPLDLDCHTTVEAIERMGFDVKPSIIDQDGDRKVLFSPAPLVERTIKQTRDQRAVSTFRLDFGAVQPELAQVCDNIGPLVRERRREYISGVPPLPDTV